MQITEQEIKEKSFALLREFSKAEERKKVWANSTKNMIEKILSAFAKGPYGIDWFCHVNIPPLHEGEFVTLQLANQTSVANPKLKRKGGNLTYSLTHRGKILVTISNPIAEAGIEEVDVQNRKAFVLNDASYEPEQITQTVIFEHVNNFLYKMLKWETNNSFPEGFMTGDEKLFLSNQAEQE